MNHQGHKGHQGERRGAEKGVNYYPRTALAVLLFGALTVLGAAPAKPTPAVPDAARTVILLTLDGVRWDAPDSPGLRTFARLEREGARARRLIPPFPSLTFTGHATLATGCSPDRHGIVANQFIDPATGERFSEARDASWLLEPPLWVWAEQHQRPAAVAAWPCSVGPWRGGDSPREYRPFGDRGPAGGDQATVDWILALLARPDATRPALIMAWTGGADHAGHEYGPDSEEHGQAMARADRLLARLLERLDQGPLARRVTLLVASDHGMAPVTRSIDVAALVPKRGYFPFVATSGPVCNVYCKGEKQAAEVGGALAGAAPGVKIFRRGEVPASLRFGGPRAGDFLLLAPPGTTFVSYGQSKKGKGSAPPAGMHGYDPAACPEMAGVLYAWGAGVAPGKSLGEARAVDVAPTVCALLGLPPLPHADGRPLDLGGAR